MWNKIKNISLDNLDVFWETEFVVWPGPTQSIIEMLEINLFYLTESQNSIQIQVCAFRSLIIPAYIYHDVQKVQLKHILSLEIFHSGSSKDPKGSSNYIFISLIYSPIQTFWCASCSLPPSLTTGYKQGTCELFGGGAQVVYHPRQASTVGKSSFLPPDVPNWLSRQQEETRGPLPCCKGHGIASGLLLYS